MKIKSKTYIVAFIIAKDITTKLNDIQLVMATFINTPFSWRRLKEAILKTEKIEPDYSVTMISATEISDSERITHEIEIKDFYKFGNYYLFDGAGVPVPEHKKSEEL